jgi:hypothetical protein
MAKTTTTPEAEPKAPAAKPAPKKVKAYRYKCTRTCFFDGSRKFEGQKLVTDKPLPKEQAGFFRLMEEITE